MANTYTCAACGETFESEWTDQEAQAEAGERFPGQTPAEMAVVCEDCYQQMTAPHPQRLIAVEPHDPADAAVAAFVEQELNRSGAAAEMIDRAARQFVARLVGH